MGTKDARSISQELAQPFAAEDLEWRLQKTFESKERTYGIAVPYVTNRAIMTRLDSVVGPENWYNDFKPWHAAGKKEAQICGISIYFEGRGFVTKWDGAEDSDIEPVKGGLSDSMKRAAVQWGIGRVLYNMDTVFVDVEQRGKSWIIRKDQRSKLDKAYLDMLNTLGLKPAPAGGIQSLLVSEGDAEPEEKPKEAPEEKPKRTVTPAIPPRDGAAPKRTVQRPEPPAEAPEQTPDPELPAYAYMVVSSKAQKGMNGTNTFLRMKSAEGKEFIAFAQGEHPMLVSGTKLSDARLSVRKQGTVVYNVLESYQIAESRERAA